MTAPKQAPERVLSTLNNDGSRFWIHPKLVKGRLWWQRAVVGYALIALFVALPIISIDGKPAMLLDILAREFTLFGTTFRPSDTFLLLLLGIASLLSIFWITALFGRIWCGWGCPQTVYMEFVFRPIESWLEGGPTQRKALDQKRPTWRRLAKWAIFAVIAFAMANIFLSYFVGWHRLVKWIGNVPSEHPFGFATVMFVSALVFFDFAYFREQMCTVACPYGRLQSVLIDPNSLIVGYDVARGEPRGKPGSKKSLPVVGEAQGDCVACNACVAVCPTGIDIRNGLQMECIGCTQCIDACEPIMEKLGRPTGLIRYSSQNELEGKPRQVVRARTILYPIGILVALTLFAYNLSHRGGTDVWVVRNAQVTYQELPGGRIATSVRVKIENKSEAHRVYRIALQDAKGELISPTSPLQLDAKKATTIPVFISVAKVDFEHGKHASQILLTDDAGFRRELAITLFGPEHDDDDAGDSHDKREGNSHEKSQDEHHAKEKDDNAKH